MAVGDVYRFSLLANQLVNDPIINTFHYIELATGGGSAFDAANTAFVSEWQALWQLSVTGDYQGMELDIYRENPVVSILHRYPLNLANWHGTAGGTTLPTQVSVVISRRSGLPGRRGRGRLFMPCVSSLWTTVDGLNLVGAAIYSAIGANLLLPMTAGGYTFSPVLFHRAKVGPPPVPASTDGITMYVVNPILRSQRRRELGLRIHKRAKKAGT